MGEVRHLSIDSLSALQDGELSGSEAVSARAHLAACAACQADAGSLARLEEALRLPPALSCEAAGPFLSATRDGEADAAETEIASHHLAACTGCQLAGSAWTALETALAASQALPSARVDQAMARLTRPERAPRGPRPTALGPISGIAWRGGFATVGGVAWRGAVVAVLAFAIAFGSTLAPRPEDAGEPAASEPRSTNALVAAVQQVVLHAATNTLYVAQPEDGTVNALDATTYAVRARIAVGGRPTALALNDPANRLIVLDGAAKRLTEIDLTSHAVVATTVLPLNGTPTSVQVDSQGKIAVFTAVAPKAPVASAAAPTEATGQVAVFDTATKALETIRNVDVAPRLVVPDPASGRTLLVSPEATTIADASYRTIETIGGGIGAAFGRRDRIAILSAAADGARLSFYGESAPAPVRLEGRPTAVIGLPDGSFAVLLDTGRGGRIVVLDPSGAAAGQTDLAVAGRGLAYDAAAKKFSVVGAGEIAAASLPGVVAQAPGSAESSPAPRASATPSPTPTPSATPSPSPATSPAASPGASPAPSASPSAPPPAIAGLPAGTVRVAPDLYRVPLGEGRVPVLVASTQSRVWFVDQRNRLASLDTTTGAVFTFQLPPDAVLRGLAAGLTHVYTVDIAKGRLFELAITSEKLSSYPLPATDVSAIAIAPEGTVWIAMPASSNVLAFYPSGGRLEVVDVGIRGAVALAADIGGRLWFSDGRNGIGSYDRIAGRVVQISWPGGPATPTVLLPDAQGRVWAGTAIGDVYVLSSGVATLAARAGRPISAFAVDASGRAWYLAPAVQQAGFVYGPVQGGDTRSVPGPASSLAIGPSGRAWLADPSGGFYLGTEAR